MHLRKEQSKRSWLKKYLGVPEDNVVGAVLQISNGRYTGRTL